MTAFRVDEASVTRIEFQQRGKTRGFASQVNLFPSPMLVFEWPAAAQWQCSIIAAINQRRARSSGMKISNRAGWPCDADLAACEDPGVQAFITWAAAMASRASAHWRSAPDVAPPKLWRVMAWAPVSRDQSTDECCRHHADRNWNWSAIYWLKLPPPDEATNNRGAIVFEDRLIGIDPESSALRSRRTFRYQPSEGELVMFPSWLYHRVEPHDGSEGILIAMNFHSEWLERSRFWNGRKHFLWRNVSWLTRPVTRLFGGRDQSDPDGPPGSNITPDPQYL